HVSESRCKRLLQVVEMLRLRSQQVTKFASVIMGHYINILCYEVVEAFVEAADFLQHSASQTRKDKVFQTFIGDLYRNACTCRDVRFYADRQCLTPRYFATIVRLRSGLTPLQWIAMFVVNEAKRMLRNPKASIKEVAENLCFADQSLFCRYFKKHAGITPGDYRRR
ncbi:MAG: helix-turn-helix domain-containing protein, partial [Muribaculaceae bacterium]